MPFLIIGFSIALIVGLFFIIANVVVWGFIIAGILWAGVSLQQLYQSKFGTIKKKSKHKGIIIEHEK